jgi:hypothetical protein
VENVREEKEITEEKRECDRECEKVMKRGERRRDETCVAVRPKARSSMSFSESVGSGSRS